MNDSRDTVPDSRRSRLRATVAVIEHELALGPEPQYRQCPVCKYVGMQVATVCGHCWTKLTPLAVPDGVVA